MNMYILLHTLYVQVNGVIIQVFVAKQRDAVQAGLRHPVRLCRLCTESAAVDERLGSNVYEVNMWLWQFGRGKPRLGGLTVEQPETMARKSTVADEQHKKAAGTKWRHKAATLQLQPDLNKKMGCDGTYSYVTVYTCIYHV